MFLLCCITEPHFSESFLIHGLSTNSANTHSSVSNAPSHNPCLPHLALCYNPPELCDTQIQVENMTYGYIRVSSDRQTVEDQRFEIGNFCKRQNLCIDGWIEETISGTKSYDKRKRGGLLNLVQKGDQIICADMEIRLSHVLQVVP